jgi:hypothetical protein
MPRVALPRWSFGRTGLVLLAVILGTSCSLSAERASSSVANPAKCSRVIAAAGDMNNVKQAKATGALAQAQAPDMVATLGDHVYPVATASRLRRVYDPMPWGQMKGIDHPVPGHHEYRDPHAQGYFDYFGKPSYYAYDIGCGWRGYALNSLADVAKQARWLRADLAAHPGVAVMATWSDPRFSSGTEHGGEPAMQPFVDALAGRTGVVLNGHEHNFERFAPAGGFRQFVAGTGGSATYKFGTPQSGSQARITGVPGVLVLTLAYGGSYTWAFKDVQGRVKDSGNA